MRWQTLPHVERKSYPFGLIGSQSRTAMMRMTLIKPDDMTSQEFNRLEVSIAHADVSRHEFAQDRTAMISAIVLAAGRSRRMGTQKLLLPFGGKPLVVRIVDELLSSAIDQIFVVVGGDGTAIAEAITDRPVHFITNTQPEGEMLSSVRCGLAAVPEESDAAIVALGDQPNITADVVMALIQSFRTTGRGIVVPTYKGQRGHPLLFAMQYRDEILTRYEGCGLRGLLDAHPQDVFDLEVATSGILEDIDVPEDYQRAIDCLERGTHR